MAVGGRMRKSSVGGWGGVVSGAQTGMSNGSDRLALKRTNTCVACAPVSRVPALGQMRG